jgi:hypothetical protein
LPGIHGVREFKQTGRQAGLPEPSGLVLRSRRALKIILTNEQAGTAWDIARLHAAIARLPPMHCLCYRLPGCQQISRMLRMEEFKPIKEYLREHYQVHSDRADIFFYFIERAIGKLRDKGSLGYIVSNTLDSLCRTAWDKLNANETEKLCAGDAF